ncbi:MAG: hypothetical protein KF761_05720 [Salinibacterium sp.]|nr:hypothetical protein [Salinibacterium sp.]
MSDLMGAPIEPTGDEFDNDPAFPEQDEPESSERRPISVRDIAVVGARSVAGLVGIGVAVATIAAAALLPLPTVGLTPGSVTVTPVPTAQQLVCAGSVLRLADDTGEGATTVSALGRPDLRSAASTGLVSTTPVLVSDASTGGTSSAPSVISTPPTAADATESALVSGAQSELVEEGDFVGLAAAGCDVASGDSWVAGGSTAVGRTTLLSLTNPSEVPATVDLELYGENGQITAPGTSGIIVPANGQRVLSLAGFQPGVVSPVVHVMSTGGQVSATLQEAIVRGLTPGGVDIIPSVAELSTETVIPGLLVTDLDAVQALRKGGDPQFDDVETAVRVFAPGEGSVSLTVNVIPEDGAATGTSFQIEVDRGRVVDVPIDELASGSYTITVASSAPLVAAARVTSAVGDVTDFAWFAGAAQLRDAAQVTAAPGPHPVLHLANITTTDTQVLVAARGGETTTTITVPAGASALVELDPGVTYSLTGFTSLFAAVTLDDGGTIAGYGVHPPGVGSGPIVVYP